MKQITTYIIEKANFLVKKHIPKTNIKEIHSYKDISYGDYYKVTKSTDDTSVHLAKLVDKGFTDIDGLLNAKFSIHGNTDKEDWKVYVNNHTGNIENNETVFSTPNEEELTLLHIVEDYVEQSKYKNYKGGFKQIGIINIDTLKFTPSSED